MRPTVLILLLPIPTLASEPGKPKAEFENFLFAFIALLQFISGVNALSIAFMNKSNVTDKGET